MLKVPLNSVDRDPGELVSFTIPTHLTHVGLRYYFIFCIVVYSGEVIVILFRVWSEETSSWPLPRRDVEVRNKSKYYVCNNSYE